MKKLGIILLIILVGLVVWMIVKTDRMTDEPIVNPNEVGTGASGQFQKLAADALVVSDQRPNDEVVVSITSIQKPGFIVVMKDASGKPGAIIGVSEFLVAGIHENIDIGTTEALMDGMRYYAATFADDGNGLFDPSSDRKVVTSEFMADADAADPRESQAVY